MAKPKITFYVDIVSPFAHIGFYVLQNSHVFKKCEITYIPMLLGGLMKACGNTPPLRIKNKDKWIATERCRSATKLNVPMSENTPPGFPINTISIQRVLTALSMSHPQFLAGAIATFYQNFWVHYNEPTKPENLLALVTTIVGSSEDAEKVLEASTGEEVKKTLTANTDRAFQEGAFGLPWFVATNSKGRTEGFWGVDHLGQLLDHLELERPTSQGWKSLL